jgi:hypothetical protein
MGGKILFRVAGRKPDPIERQLADPYGQIPARSKLPAPLNGRNGWKINEPEC